MVRMLMGDQDAHTVTDSQTKGFQGGQGRAAAFCPCQSADIAARSGQARSLPEEPEYRVVKYAILSS